MLIFQARNNKFCILEFGTLLKCIRCYTTCGFYIICQMVSITKLTYVFEWNDGIDAMQMFVKYYCLELNLSVMYLWLKM